jgi:hypothetical protein
MKGRANVILGAVEAAHKLGAIESTLHKVGKLKASECYGKLLDFDGISWEFFKNNMVALVYPKHIEIKASVPIGQTNITSAYRSARCPQFQ